MFILININSSIKYYSVKQSLVNSGIIYQKLVLNSIILRPQHIKETRKIEDWIYTDARPPPAMRLYSELLTILNQISL